MKRNLSALVLIGAMAVPALSQEDLKYEELPPAVRTYVEEVRKSCKEQDPQVQFSYPLAGIMRLSLGGAEAIAVDDEDVCAPMGHTAGANCSNRGCDFKIWKKKSSGAWELVFDRHLYRKFISVTDDERLIAIVASIYAGSPECGADPDAFFTSGQSCDVIVRYKQGTWSWDRLD